MRRRKFRNWAECVKLMRTLARKARGGVVNQQKLKPGDRIKFFVNFGCPELAEPTVSDHVVVFDGFVPQGFASGHYEHTGKSVLMTGETEVVRLWRKR